MFFWDTAKGLASIRDRDKFQFPWDESNHLIAIKELAIFSDRHADVAISLPPSICLLCKAHILLMYRTAFQIIRYYSEA